MTVKVQQTFFPEVKLISPPIFKDQRGFFSECYNQREWAAFLGEEVHFVQDNHTFSHKNVLRGLHYQVKQPQAKLIRVIVGEVFDVVVDIRPQSNTFGRYLGVYLNAHTRQQLWVPAGFAHGFYVLSDCAEVLYKTTQYWHSEYERTLIWNDPQLNIDWPINQGSPFLSEKDRYGDRFVNIQIDD